MRIESINLPDNEFSEKHAIFEILILYAFVLVRILARFEKLRHASLYK